MDGSSDSSECYTFGFAAVAADQFLTDEIVEDFTRRRGREKTDVPTFP